MRIGSFDIKEPIPASDNIHAIALLYPWVDGGSVCTLALEQIEDYLDASLIGELVRPGNFYDFTRYRPESSFVDGQRTIDIPNTKVYFASREEGPDLLFLHMMEPHAYGERYIKSIVQLLKTLQVKRYCRVSAMYNAVPHTRPIRIMGSPGLENMPGMADLVTPRTTASGYQGPTSIINNVNDELERAGIEIISVMAHLPHYLNLDEDYAGTAKLVQVLSRLYDLPSDLADFEQGKKQYDDLWEEIQSNSQIKSLVERLEEYYDDQHPANSDINEEDKTPLSPDIENFLDEIGRKLEDK